MAVAQAYPVRVDLPPFRGLWLVKWIDPGTVTPPPTAGPAIKVG